MNHHDVIKFWYGEIKDGFSSLEYSKAWFQGGTEFDDKIRDNFGELHEKAMSQQLEDWTLHPHPTLALVIILDQFSRNIYRKTAKAFAGDMLARQYSKHAISNNWDLQLQFVERIFLYMPLHHSEYFADQKLCLELFNKIYSEVDEQHKSVIENYLNYIREQLGIIEQFGRFPHRNTVLKRKNTEEERAYLEQGAPSYGQ
ncbi:DUF924 domain-containing protein [Shewanella sp. 202IG2-18]|uniref:DUF924 family protein n=1 Tax=Parashewanella hymeniacidonis TaxID=2807618 RepID=UPI0019610570|nr:DUF924 family protein [Parashewanella hymeniacidonis]MBM7070513.1 DUF924 domain-containing protein [Parashewanella hymeniacidonis]